MKRKTSRVLNDHAAMLGLSYNDITAVGAILLGFLILGKTFGFESMLWALVASITILTLLIPVRLKYRRGIIRDYVSHQIRKGTIRVSKNNRNRK